MAAHVHRKAAASRRRHLVEGPEPEVKSPPMSPPSVSSLIEQASRKTSIMDRLSSALRIKTATMATGAYDEKSETFVSSYTHPCQSSCLPRSILAPDCARHLLPVGQSDGIAETPDSDNKKVRGFLSADFSRVVTFSVKEPSVTSPIRNKCAM